MTFEKNFSLKNFNSFHIEVQADYFGKCSTIESLNTFFKTKKDSLVFLILGGGNNILFTKNFNGYVIKNEIRGIEVISEDDEHIIIKAGAGEDWDEFASYCVEQNWGGLENLSLIPGTVGSSPIQNIGAYGAEVKDVIISVDTFNIKALKNETFDNGLCEFAYRESIFKKALRHTHIITHVTFRLYKKIKTNTIYKALFDELSKRKISKPTIKDIRQVVCNIRKSKLPDPEILGNAGSFFKNPVVDRKKYEQLLLRAPKLIAHPSGDIHFKLAAGWLIENAGWKGYRDGDAAVHEKQALVLVNHGKANGNEILALAHKIKQSVFDLFGVELEFEVNIL